MTPQVKAALIVTGAIIIATAPWMYFSPYQSCVQALRALNPDAEISDFLTPPTIFCMNSPSGRLFPSPLGG